MTNKVICKVDQIASQNHAAACEENNFCFREKHKWACHEELCFLGIVDTYVHTHVSHLRFCTLFNKLESIILDESQQETILNGVLAEHDFLDFQSCHKCHKLSSNFIRRICQKKQIIAMKGSLNNKRKNLLFNYMIYFF